MRTGCSLVVSIPSASKRHREAERMDSVSICPAVYIYIGNQKSRQNDK